MTGFTHAIAGGNGKLAVTVFQSPNYIPGISGWAVFKDGSAEFNDVTIRNGEIISGKDLLYNTSPAFGKLVASRSAVAGSDAFGNAYLPYDTVYSIVGSPRVATQVGPDSIIWYTAASGAGPWAQAGAITLTPNVMTFGIALDDFTVIGPSGDATGVTDLSNIRTALIDGPTQLLPGTYYINAPLSLPDGSSLYGVNPSWGIPTGNYGAGSLPLQGAIIQAGSSFSGAALITMGSSGTTQHGGQRISNITLSGAGAPAGTHGIQSIGYVAGVKLKDIVVWGNVLIQDGLHIDNDGTAGHQADFWQVENCKFSNCAGWGVFTLGLGDSWFVNCESTGNTLGGWTITGGSDSRWIGCRADSNGGVPGFSLTPTSSANVLSFIDCEANLNGTGWVFNGSTAATYMLTNPIAHGNTTAAYSYTAGAAVRCDGGNFSVWVPIAPVNGWANSGVGPVAQYCWRGSSIEIIADLTAATPISGAGTVIFSLPGAASLAHPQQLILTDITTRTAQAALNVGIAGAVTFFQGIGAIAAADRCFVHGFVSTDA